ncbi:hypothetical protein ABZ916_24235 [Streptomyces sp. NPDC046853]|uniref:hypothetical protein n=1 Tax=Streptomyces sp. NPDC046853 TaxID=3154920 RepID=UPI0033D2C731
MTSHPRLVPAPTSLITEACDLLAYGLSKNCADSRALHQALTRVQGDYAGLSLLPVPLPLLQQLQQVLLLLCIRAGGECAPGENVVRFARGADRVRAIVDGDTQGRGAPAPHATRDTRLA